MTLHQTLQQALKHHQAKQFPEAQALYRQILALDHNNFQALNNLGAILQETGRYTEAITTLQKASHLNPKHAGIHHNLATALLSAGQTPEALQSYRRAIELDPKSADFHASLATALKSDNQIDAAIAAYRDALALRPDHAQALNNLAATLLKKNNLNEALAVAQKAVKLHPNYPQAHNTLGNILKSQNKFPAAIAAYTKALTLKPDFADAHNNLGIALQSQARIDDAIASFQRATSLDPTFAEALCNLGFALKDKSLFDQAHAAFEKALAISPTLVSAHLNLGLLYRELGNLDQSLIWFQKAIALQPDNPIALNGLANTEKDRGNVTQALAYFRQALAVSPDSSTFNSNVLYTLHFHPDFDAPKILDEHRLWDQRIAQPLRTALPSPQLQPIANRRLRIGYVSPDLRGHVVGRHLLPLLANHDRTRFEIFCYTDVRRPDSLTNELRQHTDHWKPTLGLSDADLADLIRADRIDILVDLTLHMAGTRLLAFARKPAPIQITYLGYCSTTGLSAVDYRLSDPHLDPPESEKYYVEKTVRLPRTYWCYQLKSAAPDVSPLPAETTGHITFGCLNNFAKVSTAAQDLWARLLMTVPNSRLLIHCGHGSHRIALLDRLSQTGVSPDRVQFFTGGPWETYMRQYHQIDIALDPFPYAGGITTCDALYMGVPVVTLLGPTAVGRGGASLLTNVGLPDLIAKTPDDYLRIATTLATDLPKLSALRQILRTQMQNSPLMDAAAFARDFETIYRRLADDAAKS